VADTLCLPGKSEIIREILSYLLEHPDAQDTFEGIIQWWLLERKIIYQTSLVEKALAELVTKGFLVKRDPKFSEKTERGLYRYKVNKRKLNDIRRFLEQQK